MALTYLRESIPQRVSYSVIMEQPLMVGNPFTPPETYTPIKLIGLFNQAVHVYEQGGNYSNPFRMGYYFYVWEAALTWAIKNCERKEFINGIEN